jgi:hypothetical protein
MNTYVVWQDLVLFFYRKGSNFFKGRTRNISKGDNVLFKRKKCFVRFLWLFSYRHVCVSYIICINVCYLLCITVKLAFSSYSREMLIFSTDLFPGKFIWINFLFCFRICHNFLWDWVAMSFGTKPSLTARHQGCRLESDQLMKFIQMSKVGSLVFGVFGFASVLAVSSSSEWQ